MGTLNRIIAIVVTCSIICLNSEVYALEKPTNQYLNTNIVRQFSMLNIYLQSNLGLIRGIDETLKEKQ
jgi:hypothetical protein